MFLVSGKFTNSDFTVYVKYNYAQMFAIFLKVVNESTFAEIFVAKD